MLAKKTHRENRRPKITARFLADYMAASESSRRTIIRDCKYQFIGRVVQHDEAKEAISDFLSAGRDSVVELAARIIQLRGRMADDDFTRDVFDHNADYIARFLDVQEDMAMPEAERLPPGATPALEIHGVRVTSEIHVRLRRVTRTNKVMIGAGMLRYAKGRALVETAALWQSAFIHGYLMRTAGGHGETPELALCVTVDAYAGKCHPAPGDSIRRFHNMEAACATIAERWPAIQPPPKAVL